MSTAAEGTAGFVLRGVGLDRASAVRPSFGCILQSEIRRSVLAKVDEEACMVPQGDALVVTQQVYRCIWSEIRTERRR
jgi:hypothetical protein